MTQLKSYSFKKIVRDNIISLLEGAGVKVHRLPIESENQRLRLYKQKLLEEAQEVCQCQSQDELLEELADCLEVLHGMFSFLGVNMERIDQARLAKRKQKGGFTNGDAVDYVTLSEDHTFAQYCQKKPEQYPEIKKQLAS